MQEYISSPQTVNAFRTPLEHDYKRQQQANHRSGRAVAHRSGSAGGALFYG